MGGQPPPTGVANTESYNGSSWTEVNDLNQARCGNEGSGTSTSALSYGGLTTAYVALTESWNGSSWTETGDLNSARGFLNGLGADSTSALAFGGATPPVTAITE